MRNKMVVVLFVFFTVGINDTKTQLSSNPLDPFATSPFQNYYFIFVSHQSGQEAVPEPYTPPQFEQGTPKPPFPLFPRRAISNAQFPPYSGGYPSTYPFQGNYPSFQPQQPSGGEDGDTPQNPSYPGAPRGNRGFPPMRYPPPPQQQHPNPFDNVYNEEGDKLQCRMVCLTDQPTRSRGRSSDHKKKEKEKTSSEEEEDDDDNKSKKGDKEDDDKKKKGKDDKGDDDDKKNKKDGDKDQKKNNKEDK